MAEEREVSVTDTPEGYVQFSEKQLKEQEKILQEVRSIVRRIHDNDCDPTKSSNEVKKISDFFYDRKKGYIYRSAIGDTLAETGYAKMTYKLMKAKKELGYFPSGLNIIKTIPQNNTTFNIFDNAWNYSVSSKLFCNNLMETDIVQILLDNLKMYPNRSPTRKENRKEYYMIKASLSIITNLSRRPENKKLFDRYISNRDVNNQEGAAESDEPDIIEVLQEFKTSKDKLLRVLAISALAGIARNEDIDKITNDEETIETMVQWMNCAVDEGEAYEVKWGYTATYICDIIDKLAINGNVDLLLNKTQLLSTLYRMLESTDLKQKISASKCVWRLAFNASGKSKIREHRASTTEVSKTIPNTLKKLWWESTNMDLFRNVEGALFTLFDKEYLEKARAEKRPELLQMETSDGGSHVDPSYEKLRKRDTGSFIFISYCWNEQKIVLKINKMLEERGYSVWLDINKMSGSILDKMAFAVENACLVLMCVSEGYSQSHNCGLEAKYVDKLRKKFIPVMVSQEERFRGWLGILLGDSLYISHTSLGEASQLENQIEMNVSAEERKKILQITDGRSKKESKQRKEEKKKDSKGASS